MAYNPTITFGSLTLSIDSMNENKKPHTSKQIVGKTLIEKPLPGSNIQDWELNIVGRHIDANRSTDRTTLQSYDDLVPHTLTDGIHDGNYYIKELTYDDKGNEPTSYTFRLTLVQDQ